MRAVGGVDGHCGGVDGQQLQGACQWAGWYLGEGGGERRRHRGALAVPQFFG